MESDHTKGSAPRQEHSSQRARFHGLEIAKRLVKAQKLTFLAAIAYGLTVYCSLTAASLKSPLGLVSPTHGILIIHILSKFSDIALGMAISSMWASIQWSRVFSKGGTSLPTYFALGGPTGKPGLWEMLVTKANVSKETRFWSLFR